MTARKKSPSLDSAEDELRTRFPGLYLGFRRTWPRLQSRLSEEVLSAWAQGVLNLAAASADGAAPALILASAPVAALLSSADFARWQAAGTALAGSSSPVATSFFQTSPRTLEGVAPEARGLFLGLCLQVIGRDPARFPAWLDKVLAALMALPRAGQRPLLRLAKAANGGLGTLGEATSALSQLSPEHRVAVLSLAEGLIRSSEEGALAFLKGCPQILNSIDLPALEKWWTEGERLLRHDPEAGLRFLRREAPESQEFLNALGPGVELKAVREVLMLYTQALTNVRLQVLPTSDLTKLDIGWSGVEAATTEGTAIFCPERVQVFASQPQNFEVYKVLVAHQAGHLERGSFDFDLGRRSTRFTDLRPLLAQARPPQSAASIPLARFFDLFTHRRLATDVFVVAEDARVDAQLTADYRGLRQAYHRVQVQALEKRPPLKDLPLREACLEALLRFSANGPGCYWLPQFLADTMMEAASYLRMVQRPATTVEDAAETTLRLYTLLRPIPNRLPWPEPLVEIDLSQASYPPEEDPKAMARRFLEVDTPPALDGLESQDRPYHNLPYLEFRGRFKPELVQTLSQLREEMADPSARADISTEELKELLIRSVELESPPLASMDPALVAEVVMANLLRELGKGWGQDYPSHRPTRRRRVWRPEAESLLQGEAIPFAYDEWDFRRRAYRSKWCTLWERPLEEGATAFYEETLKHHKGLLIEIKRQFELLKPSRRRRHKRLPDGEEFDLDAVVEAVVERRVGRGSSEKAYWRRDKTERDVAVAILLDMSVSTMESIEIMGQVQEGKQPKRIIDLEKESLVLLTQALEMVGDNYGIYGFSGLGRHNVQFFVIKDFRERLTDRVRRRIDRMLPVQGTRMAPAIRHTITKLEECDSKTRLLILISDGRPQDQDYGRDSAEATYVWGNIPESPPPSPIDSSELATRNRVRDAVIFQELLMRREKEYAVHDTRRALLEARQKKIIPFCLSVDRHGHDYLRAMCGDMGYEVVSDINALPQRLTALYRRLTT